MSDFMQRQITGNEKWVELDGPCGVTALPADVLSADEFAIAESVSGDNADSADLTANFGEYYEGSRIDSVTVREGFGARLSAPGYLDCTEWCVFDTEDEARAYLDEYYPEDEEDESPVITG